MVIGRLFQQRDETIDFTQRILVSFRGVGRLIQDRVDQDGDGLRHAIED